MVFKTNYCLMQVKSIAECSNGEHSAIRSTFIELPFVIKIFVLSIFEWPFYPGFTVYLNLLVAMAAVRSKAEIRFVLSLMIVVSPFVFGVLCLVLFLCFWPFKLGFYLAEEKRDHCFT